MTQAQLEAALDSFRGEIAQIPPMYSAIKVNGQKLYALARQGKAVERAPRPVTIFALDLLGGAGADWRLRVHCSKGTYVRTLCHDIGAALGCGGCLSALRRTRAGAYDVTRSHTMAEILAAENPEALLLPTDSLFSDRPALKVAENAERKLRNGAPLHTPKLKGGEYRVYNQAGDFLLLAQVANGELKTVKSFFEV